MKNTLLDIIEGIVLSEGFDNIEDDNQKGFMIAKLTYRVNQAMNNDIMYLDYQFMVDVCSLYYFVDIDELFDKIVYVEKY
jgi:hypothetical protein